jgi:ribosomal protein S18 acetylase RimI-like enzyme
MKVRLATPGDAGVLRELWEEFCREVPPPPGGEETWDEEWRDTLRDIEAGLVFVAEDDEDVVGAARGHQPVDGTGHVEVVQVRPRARRQGVAKALLRELVAALRERGADRLTLEVMASNAVARAVWTRLGFEELKLTMHARAEAVERRLSDVERGSFGSVHVQTDDRNAVVRALRQYLPRLPGRSEGTIVAPPRNGWVAVYDELCDREPELLRRVAREVSDRMGAVVLSIGLERGEVVRYLVYERGRMVDEYMSVPDYYGELPPGDAVALAANPTVLARLTGADPRAVRAVARTARSPQELPPAPALLASIAEAIGIEAAEHGYAEAAGVAGAERIERE